MPEKKRVGSPTKYDEPLDTRITVLVSKKFKEDYCALIKEKYVSEHILNLMKKDYADLSTK